MRYVPLVEVKHLLINEQKKHELTASQKLALEHAQRCTKLKYTITKKLIKELAALEKVSDTVACKLGEVLPTHPDDVRAVFAKERYTLGDDEITQILDIVRKHME